LLAVNRVGLKQPTGNGFVMMQLSRLSGQQDKDGLRDFRRLMRIVDMPQRDGINQIDVPRHQWRIGVPMRDVRRVRDFAGFRRSRTARNLIS
jgi:hypothetical protein